MSSLVQFTKYFHLLNCPLDHLLKILFQLKKKKIWTSFSTHSPLFTEFFYLTECPFLSLFRCIAGLQPSCKYLKVRFGDFLPNEVLQFNFKIRRHIGYIAMATLPNTVFLYKCSIYFLLNEFIYTFGGVYFCVFKSPGDYYNCLGRQITELFIFISISSICLLI